MTNPFSEEELATFERLEREKVRHTKRFMREAHYKTQKIDCCQNCLYGECNEDYAECSFGDIKVDIDWCGICDIFVPKYAKQEASK